MRERCRGTLHSQYVMSAAHSSQTYKHYECLEVVPTRTCQFESDVINLVCTLNVIKTPFHVLISG